MAEQLVLVDPPRPRSPERRVQARPTLPDRDRVTPGPDVLRRFRSKIVTTSGCWWWTGAISGSNGYGAFAVTRDRVVGAHRYGLEVALGRRLLATEVAAHGCDEPLCVRPGDGHVAPATVEENIAHMVLRGRRRGRWVLDARGPAGRSRAIRTAINDAVASGQDVETAVLSAKAAGDPQSSHAQLWTDAP